MDGMVQNNSAQKWILHISVALLVAVWLAPTLGLFVSSFRTRDQIIDSGWWAALFTTEQNVVLRAADPDDFRVADGGVFTVSGNLFGEGASKQITVWGTSSRAIDAYVPGDAAGLGDGESITVQADGGFVWRGSGDQLSGRGQRVFATARAPPEFTLANYRWMLFDEKNVQGISQAFFNTLTVAIPATVIPLVVAAFAAYALAWMNIRGRAWLITAVIVGLVFPGQLALIPILKLHLGMGIDKGYLSVWLVHTGLGQPFAIYLLRNYMAGIPREIIENARVDGATDFQIFVRIVLPLSVPALGAYAIIQFLWMYNDLLAAMVFLMDATGDNIVMTDHLNRLQGTWGGSWELLSTSAFISMAVPLAVFFAMQRYFARGLLAGSVKG